MTAERAVGGEPSDLTQVPDHDGHVIRLLATGGTIATVADPASGTTRPARTVKDLLEGLAPPPGFSFEARQLSNVPSWSLSPHDMQGIALAVRDAARDPRVRGVVVTHGTATLEYTAFLADLFLDTRTPVVFTGAMRRADSLDSDGPANLKDAVRVAANGMAQGLGVVVCFAGRVIAARDAWKEHRNSLDTFVATSGDVGRVTGRRVRIFRRPERRHVFSGHIEPAVALVKAYPGAGSGDVQGFTRAGLRGLVVEGFPGAGGIPARMAAGLVTAAAHGTTVVVASRAPRGTLPPEIDGGTGQPLRGTGFLSAGELTAEKAWVLLMAVLGDATEADRVRGLFGQVAMPWLPSGFGAR